MKEKGIMIKDFRKKVAEAKDNITDKGFFLSESCGIYLQNLATAITKEYSTGIDIHIQWTDDPVIAYATDRGDITINLNNEFMLKAETRIKKLVAQKGLILHECGHLLFTDFHLNISRENAFFKRKLFPTPSCAAATEFLSDLQSMNLQNVNLFYKILDYIDNSLEDGFIENMILKSVPGEGKCLMLLRDYQLDGFPSVEAQLEEGKAEYIIALNSLLSYAKYEKIKCNDVSIPAIKFITTHKGEIHKITHTYKAYDRMKLVNELFCEFYVYLKQEKKQERSQNQSQSSQDDSGSGSSQNNPEQQNSVSSSDSDNRNDENSNENNNQNGEGQKQSGDQKEPGNSKMADKSNSSSTGSDQSTSNPNKSRECSKQNNDPESQNPIGNNASGLSARSETNSSGSTENTNSSTDINNLFSRLNKNMDDIINPDINDNLNLNSGSALNDKSIERLKAVDQFEMSSVNSSNSNMPESLEIDRITTNIAEQTVRENEQIRLDNELKQSVESFDFSELNNNVEVNMLRGNTSNSAMQLYQYFCDNGALKMASAMAKEIRRKIKDQQQGGKLDGLYNGRYLDRNHLYRMDKKIFCKNDLPEDIPNMAISILVDCSGSMSAQAKLLYAMQTALIIYEFGQMMNIPVMVYGHNYSGGMYLYSLAEFNTVDGQDKYRICSLNPGGCNRDGMALRYCADVVANRQEDKKFVFIISDGKPSAYYSQSDAYKDIRNVLMEYSKKKVRFITFGLGNDQKGIEDIYCQDMSRSCTAKFVSTNEPQQLPKAVVKAIKELI